MGATALILAAGEGTRMKSSLPKVAHRILGVPMVGHAVGAARAAGCDRVIVVTGHRAEVVEAIVHDVEFVRQDRQLGTGHAVMCAEEALAGSSGSLLVLAGDCPLLTPSTLARLVAAREDAGAACSVLTTRLGDPTGYGRIVRDRDGSIASIVEHKDLAEAQYTIDEVNTSTYCFDTAALFEHLHRLQNANAQGEYYLTDMVAHLRDAGLDVVAVEAADPDETLGVNSRVQLSEAAAVLQRRINERHMLQGVTMTDPGLVWIGPEVAIGRDTVIEPLTFVFGDTVVGEECVLGPDCRLTDCRVGNGCVVDSSILTGTTIADHTTVGPWACRGEGVGAAGDAAPGVSGAARTDTIPCDDGVRGSGSTDAD